AGQAEDRRGHRGRARPAQAGGERGAPRRFPPQHQGEEEAVAMALAVLIAASLSAQPAQLVLGKDSGADLEIRASAGAKVTFSTTVGTVSGAQHQGGVVRARLNATPLRGPSVRLVP